MSFITAADAEFKNINSIPVNLIRVGYTTGSVDIKWPTNVFKPSDVRLCQDHGSDKTADGLDIEPDAATNQDAANWWPLAHANFENSTRPGQRFPMLYTFTSNVTPLVNTLIANHITSGPVLFLAEPNDGLVTAEQILAAAGGPFPIVGIQYKFSTLFDLDVFSSDWYNTVSKAITVKPLVPPGQWNDPNAWTWKDAATVGVGMDNRFHGFHFNVVTGKWDRIA